MTTELSFADWEKFFSPSVQDMLREGTRKRLHEKIAAALKQLGHAKVEADSGDLQRSAQITGLAITRLRECEQELPGVVTETGLPRELLEGLAEVSGVGPFYDDDDGDGSARSIRESTLNLDGDELRARLTEAGDAGFLAYLGLEDVD